MSTDDEHTDDEIGEEDRKQIHVLDLPHPSTKPSASALIDALNRLALRPSSFTAASACAPKVIPDGIPEYLTRVVASPLGWIESEVEQEKIWELASQRLTERSGRSGAGPIDRNFVISLDDRSTKRVTFRIHEPALTGDNLGLKTWGSSYAIANQLKHLRPHFEHITHGSDFPAPDPLSLSRRINSENANVLELGAGTGLLGMAFAVVFELPVISTDLTEIVPNLHRNVSINEEALESTSHSNDVTVGTLDWTAPEQLKLHAGEEHLHVDPFADRKARFDIIVAADPIYAPEHPYLLVNTIKIWLRPTKGARVLIAYPLREVYKMEIQALTSLLLAQGPMETSTNSPLVILAEGRTVGGEDWRDGDEVVVEYKVFGL